MIIEISYKYSLQKHINNFSVLSAMVTVSDLLFFHNNDTAAFENSVSCFVRWLTGLVWFCMFAFLVLLFFLYCY